MSQDNQSPVCDTAPIFAELANLDELEHAADPVEGAPGPEYPRSPRAFSVLLPILQPVIDAGRLRAKNYVGFEIPFCGITEFTDVQGNIQDVAVVPLPFSSQDILNHDQFPIVIETKPPEVSTPGEEISFGRLPMYMDANDRTGGDELVLAIPSYHYIADCMRKESDHGRNVGTELYDDLAFVARGWAETDDRFLQLLPYMVFYKKINGKIYVWAYQRSKYTAEGRLAKGCSIGIGGHPNPGDFIGTVLGKYSANNQGKLRTSVTGFWQGIINCMTREIREEITAFPEGTVSDIIHTTDLMFGDKPPIMTEEKFIFDKTVFFLDYASTDVEKHHLAMFTAFEVPEDTCITSNERDLIALGFIPIDEVVEEVPTPLEPWSRAIVDSVRIATGQLRHAKENHVLNGTISAIFGNEYRRYDEKINVFMKI